MKLTLWDMAYGVLWGFAASVLVGALVFASGCYQSRGAYPPAYVERAGVLRVTAGDAGGVAFVLETDAGDFALAPDPKRFPHRLARRLNGRHVVVTCRNAHVGLAGRKFLPAVDVRHEGRR